MCALGGRNGAISSKRIAVIPSLFMNVLQKLLRDFFPEYISNISDEIKKLCDKNNYN